MAILCLLLRIYSFVIFARLILSWFPQIPESVRPIASFLYAITEPVLRPARGLIPPMRIGMGAMDFSPILVFVVLGIVSQAVCAAA